MLISAIRLSIKLGGLKITTFSFQIPLVDFEAKNPGLDELVSALIVALQRPRRAS
jgi:hypothetical protein